MFKPVKFLLVTVVSTILLLPAQAQAAKLELEAGIFGGTLYQISFAFAELVKKRLPDLEITLAETSGTAAGIIKAAQSPQDRFIAGTSTSVQEALHGISPYPQSFTELRMIANLVENVNFTISLDPKLNTLQSLAGKRLGMGTTLSAPGRNHWSVISQSIPGSDKMRPAFMNWSALQGALLDGGIDAMVMGVTRRQSGNWPPVPAYQEIAVSRGTPTFIPVEEAGVVAASEKDGISYPTRIIPKDIIAPGAPPEDILGWVDGLGYFAFADFPEEYAYQIVKLLHEYCLEMGEISAAARGLWPEMVLSFPLPDDLLHPGTLRYLKELGLR